MKFKPTDCTFLFENIFADMSCILKEIIIIADNIVNRFQIFLHNSPYCMFLFVYIRAISEADGEARRL